MATKEPDVLYFRLRIPRRMADIIADQAYASHRSANAEVLLMLEDALGIPGLAGELKTPKTRMPGQSAAGTIKKSSRRREVDYDSQGGFDERVPLTVMPPEGPRTDPRDVFSKISPKEIAELQDIYSRLGDIFGGGSSAPKTTKATKTVDRRKPRR